MDSGQRLNIYIGGCMTLSILGLLHCGAGIQYQ